MYAAITIILIIAIICTSIAIMVGCDPDESRVSNDIDRVNELENLVNEQRELNKSVRENNRDQREIATSIRESNGNATKGIDNALDILKRAKDRDNT